MNSKKQGKILWCIPTRLAVLIFLYGFIIYTTGSFWLMLGSEDPAYEKLSDPFEKCDHKFFRFLVLSFKVIESVIFWITIISIHKGKHSAPLLTAVIVILSVNAIDSILETYRRACGEVIEDFIDYFLKEEYMKKPEDVVFSHNLLHSKRPFIDAAKNKYATQMRSVLFSMFVNLLIAGCFVWLLRQYLDEMNEKSDNVQSEKKSSKATGYITLKT